MSVFYHRVTSRKKPPVVDVALAGRWSDVSTLLNCYHQADKETLLKKSLQRKALQGPNLSVGAPGFEPGTSCSQSRRDTGLRYAPRASQCIRALTRNQLQRLANFE